MKKYLSLLLFTLISSGLLAENYGSEPYKFDFHPGVLEPLDVEANRYLLSVCDGPQLYTFSFQNSRRYSLYSTNINGISTLVYSSESDSVSSFSVSGFSLKDTLTLIGEETDTIATIITESIPSVYLNELEITTFTQDVQINGTDILICEPNKSQSIYFELLQDGLGACQNVQQDAQFYLNDELMAGPFVDINQLQDGDIIRAEYFNTNNSLFPFSFCDCIETPNIVSTPEYVVKKGNYGNFSFSETNRHICPGDTLSLDAPEGTTAVNWFHKKDPATFYRSKFDSTELAFSVTQPMDVYAEVYTESGACPAKSDTVTFYTTPNCTQGYLSGVVFNDKDYNNYKNYSESAVGDIIVKIVPGDQLVYANEDGKFDAYVPVGELYQIYALTDETMFSDTLTIDFSDPFKFNSKTDIEVPVSVSSEKDLAVEIYGNRARPGFQTKNYIDINNYGSVSMAAEIRLELDSRLSNPEFSLTPTSSSGNVYIWNKNLTAFASEKIVVTSTIPANVELLGEMLASNVSISPDTEDPDLTNNQDTLYTVITGAYDPNDKQVLTKNGQALTTVTETTGLDYMIRFQNTGTDTAFTVRIIDTLSAEHNPESFKMLSASHNYDIEIINNTIVWTFENILLPDSNINEPESHGFVKFSIAQKEGNELGTEINNKAYIYFDFNPPIETNETSVEVGNGPVITNINSGKAVNINLFPNPASDVFTIEAPVKGTLQISDMAGKVIYSSDYKNSVTLNKSVTGSGVFIITLFTDSKVVKHKLIVKDL